MALSDRRVLLGFSAHAPCIDADAVCVGWGGGRTLYQWRRASGYKLRRTEAGLNDVNLGDGQSASEL